MRSIVLVLALLALVLPLSARAQTADLAGVIAQYRDQIEKPSRQTVEPVVAAIAATGPQGTALLQAWGDRLLGLRKSDGLLVIAAPEGDALHLTDAATGADLGPSPEDQVTLLRPNSGVRGLISAAMAGSALSDPDPKRRAEALEALSRKGDAAQRDRCHIGWSAAVPAAACARRASGRDRPSPAAGPRRSPPA